MLRTWNTLWFGGQGSPSLLSHQSARQAENDAQSSVAAATFLSRCHAAFLREASFVQASERELFSNPILSAKSLLYPSPELHSNPIIQSTTICLYQLLRLLAVACINGRDPAAYISSISETSGICSGFLTAAVLASAHNEQDLVDHGVEAYRLAFWMGYRARESVNRSQIDNPKPRSCLLFFPNVEESLLKHKISHFNEKCHSNELFLAGRFSKNKFSVAGRPDFLSRFQETVPTRSIFAHVHDALYHGGKLSEEVIQAVLNDVSTQKINFPKRAHLRRVLRSSVTGEPLAWTVVDKISLAEIVTRHIFTEPVNWLDMVEKTLRDFDTQARNLHTPMRVESYGPDAFLTTNHLKHEYPSRDFELCDRSQAGNEHGSTLSPPPESKDIAIVGISTQFPGSEGLEGLWETLANGKDETQKIPPNRFRRDDLKTTGRTLNANHGSFLDDVWGFDAEFFKVSPREARSMDPQQRLLLHAAQTALDDAGYSPDSTPSFSRQTFGCFVGCATGDYTDNLRNNIDVYYSTGTLRAFLSGKISHAYGWSGPSIVTDTACSSSIVAVHQACQSLINFESGATLVGGVNTITSPDMFIGLDRAHFLSPTGGCKPFDASADGYGRAEGCGVIILKRLTDALAEGDKIHAVIKASAMNQSGLAHSITHPHYDTQINLFHQLFSKTQVSPQAVDFVEMHGTGTQAGDAAEVQSISTFFKNTHTNDRPLFLGSIKGNISHCEAASGIAGLAKLVLMMRKEIMPPQANFTHLNPALSEWLDSSTKITTEARPWVGAMGARAALLNNFGAAGSNCALLVQEQKQLYSRPDNDSRSAYSFCVSARNLNSLHALLESYSRTLRTAGQTTSLGDACFTASARRQLYTTRVAFNCTSIEDLTEQIDRYVSERKQPSPTTKTNLKGTIFVFSGQGSLYMHMGSELYATEPLYRQVVDECDSFLGKRGLQDVRGYLDGTGRRDSLLEDPEHTVGSQCACVIHEYALSKLLFSWDIVPDVVMGHSLGEYAALAVAGFLAIEDALKIAMKRAQLMVAHCEPYKTGMLACKTSSSDVSNMLSEAGLTQRLDLACINSPTDCVLSGPLEHLKDFERRCKESGVKCKALQVPYGFHSRAMDPILSELAKFSLHIPIHAPKICMVSNVSGAMLKKDDIKPDYFARHSRGMVPFEGMIKHLEHHHELESSLFLEVGPHPTSLPLVKTCLPHFSNIAYLPCLQKEQPPWVTLSKALGSLHERGYAIRWRQVFASARPRFIPLPGHPMFKQHFEVPYVEVPTAQPVLESNFKPTGFNLVPHIDCTTSNNGSIALTADSAKLSLLASGHKVAGIAMCPASVSTELLLESVTISNPPVPGSVYTISELEFSNALAYSSPESAPNVVVQTKVPDRNVTVARICFHPKSKPEVSKHCEAIISVKETDSLKQTWRKTSRVIERQIEHLSKDTPGKADTFTTKTLYETVFTRVVSYSSPFQTLLRLSVNTRSLEGYGVFKIPNPGENRYVISPFLTDTLLHAAGFIANATVSSDQVYICHRVGAIDVLYDQIDLKQSFSVYCSLVEIEKGVIAADAYAINNKWEIVAAATDIEFKRLKLASFHSHLKRSVEDKPTSEASSRRNVGGGSLKSHDYKSRKPQEHSEVSLENGQAPHKLVEVLAEVFGVESAQLDYSKTLEELGVDSLMLLELQSALGRAYGGTDMLQQLEVDLSWTVDSLLNAIQKSLDVSVSTTATTSIEATRTPSPHESAITTPDEPDVPSTSARSSCSKEKLNELCQLVADLTGASQSSVTPVTSLEALGFDSLLYIELGDAMRNKYRSSITDDAVLDCEDIKSLGSLIAPETSKGTATISRVQPTAADFGSSLKFLQDSHSHETPLLLIHDGSGSQAPYASLQDINRPLYAISRTKILNCRGSDDIDALADAYLRLWTEQIGNRSVILGGWSFGGVVAYAMATLAPFYNIDVKGLILIDAPSPINHKPLPEAIASHVLSTAMPPLSSKQQKKLRDAFSTHASILGKYKPRGVEIDVHKVVYLRSRELYDAKSLAGVDYAWLSEEDERRRVVDVWQNLVGTNVETTMIPGNHFEVFLPRNITLVTQAIVSACVSITK